MFCRLLEKISANGSSDSEPIDYLSPDLFDNFDQLAEILSGKTKNGAHIKATKDDWQKNVASGKELLKKIEKLVPYEIKSLTIDESIAPERIENPPPEMQSTDDLLEKIDEKLPPSKIKNPTIEPPIIDEPIAPERAEDPPPEIKATDDLPEKNEKLPPSANLIVDPKTNNAIKERLEVISEKITKIKRKEVDTENTLEKLKSRRIIFKNQATDILDKESTYKVIEADETYMICMNEKCKEPVKLITGETVPEKCYFPHETEISFAKRAATILPRLIVNELKNFSHEQYLMKLKMGSRCTQCGCEIQNHQPTKKQLVAILKPDVEREYKEVEKEIEETLTKQRRYEEYQKSLEEKCSSLANNAAKLSASFFFYFSNEKSDPFLVYLEAIQSNERMKKKSEVGKLLLNKLKMIENEHKERVQEFLCQMEDGLRKSVEFEEINTTMVSRKTSRYLLR